MPFGPGIGSVNADLPSDQRCRHCAAVGKGGATSRPPGDRRPAGRSGLPCRRAARRENIHGRRPRVPPEYLAQLGDLGRADPIGQLGFQLGEEAERDIDAVPTGIAAELGELAAIVAVGGTAGLRAPKADAVLAAGFDITADSAR